MIVATALDLTKATLQDIFDYVVDPYMVGYRSGI